jgi:hypothetical protein
MEIREPNHMFWAIVRQKQNNHVFVRPSNERINTANEMELHDLGAYKEEASGIGTTRHAKQNRTVSRAVLQATIEIQK